ncbi:MAG: LLM class flavin-dependent oxidoreductase [Dehalococcoidia bacterium]|nr:LLM class flavin-dependent oxidoreductase [Dehalococcoidia bacterium]
MRVTIGLPIWGDPPAQVGIDAMVADCREAGMDGIFVGDHLAFSPADPSKYPYSDSGQFFLAPEDAWYECFVTLGYVAAYAGSMELGLGVCLPVLRPPLLVAKQVATLAHLAKGDVTLGVGAGWMQAEFEAVGVPWKQRGRRLEDSVAVIRQYWTGAPSAGRYGDYVIPEDMVSYPIPSKPLPVLVGGSSAIAVDRAARIGDGWFGALGQWEDGDALLAPTIAKFRAAWTRHRPGVPDPPVAVVQPVPSAVTRDEDFARLMTARLTAYCQMGVAKVVLNLSWRRPERVPAVLEVIRAAADRALDAALPQSTPTGG